MLLELIRHTITKCPRYIKKMGYLYESISIDSKYKRCKNDWHHHLESCKSEIINKTESMPTHNTVIILGAGSLLDIPITELSNKFCKIILIDIVQSKQIKQAIKKHKNIQFIQDDVTGVIEGVYISLTIPKNIKGINFPITLGADDLVISANIASQLPILPLQFLGHNISDESKQRFAQQLIQQHFNSIAQQKSQYIILTDYQRIYYDKSDKEIYSEDALYGTKIKYQQHWDWHITPINENKNYKVIHKVASIINQPTN